MIFKEWAIGFIKENPGCSKMDVAKYFSYGTKPAFSLKRKRVAELNNLIKEGIIVDKGNPNRSVLFAVHER